MTNENKGEEATLHHTPEWLNGYRQGQADTRKQFRGEIEKIEENAAQHVPEGVKKMEYTRGEREGYKQGFNAGIGLLRDVIHTIRAVAER